MIRVKELSRTAFASLAAFLFVMAVFAGCGGDDGGGSGRGENGDADAGITASDESGANDTGDGSSSDSDRGAIETSSLPKKQFIAQANEICKQETPAFIVPVIRYIERNKGSGKSEKQLAADAVREVVLPKFQSQHDQIHDLGAPGGDEAEIEAFLSTMQEAIDSLEQKQQVNLATDIDEAFKPAGDLAHRYGMQGCL